MFTPPLSEKELAEMAAAGLTPEDLARPDVEVWPENQREFFLFSFMQTQWRTGAMGFTGLDYDILWQKMNRMALSPDEFDEVEACIRAMEFAALGAMSGRGND